MYYLGKYKSFVPTVEQFNSCFAEQRVIECRQSTDNGKTFRIVNLRDTVVSDYIPHFLIEDWEWFSCTDHFKATISGAGMVEEIIFRDGAASRRPSGCQVCGSKATDYVLIDWGHTCRTCYNLSKEEHSIVADTDNPPF